MTKILPGGWQKVSRNPLLSPEGFFSLPDIKAYRKASGILRKCACRHMLVSAMLSFYGFC
jgi:hypothetical protein